jgi:hypothetical protein
MVERAGPGGEGNVIDHFSRSALDAYLKKFDDAFAGRDLTGLRAYFNDSYEVDDAAGNADFTPQLFDEFERRRGYDLRGHLPALFGKSADDEENARVLCDYRETLSDLLLEEFTQPWTAWANARGAVTRNQAHGSPANILDLYAASDIPETEGTDRIQFMAAASAAHITGKRLVSAEAATWLDEHFLGTLAETKRWVDDYFLGGVNHICYHGTCYSPESEPWPGRLFYASVELQPTNPQWRHFHALNEYVARCQAFLQAGEPDSDVLVYWPIHDEWARRGRTTLAHFNGQMADTSIRRAAEDMLAQGVLADFISDRQIAGVTCDDGQLRIGDAAYRALVIPRCASLPVGTLLRILKLAEAGGHVAFIGGPPATAPGMAGIDADRDSFETLARRLSDLFAADQVVQADDASAAFYDLRRRGALDGEPFTGGRSPRFIRRRFDDGHCYFIVNSGAATYEEITQLKVSAESVAAFDPLTGERGVLASRPGIAADGTRVAATFVRLRLEPGQSIILRTFDHAIDGPVWSYVSPQSAPTPIAGPWRLSFVDGGPALPEPIETLELKSWTELGGDAVKKISGVARYAIEFKAPAGSVDADAWLLDLGDVRESAEVRLNGEPLGVVFCRPYHMRIAADKLRERNLLEVDVANLMANRIADLDRRGVPWKKFYNVNMAARRRENAGERGVFDASKWDPVPAGLLGPVTLTALKIGADNPAP